MAVRRFSETELQMQHDFKGQQESAPATFTIAGLTLNKSTSKDVEARFGPSTPASRSSYPDGFNECYKSAKWPVIQPFLS